MERWWKSDTSCLPCVPCHLQRSFQAVVCLSDGDIDCPECCRQLDNPPVICSTGGAWGLEVISVREISDCYLTSRYPPILGKSVGHTLKTAMCWFVIRADKLNSSVQVCIAGSLHDYVTLLQVHNFFLDLHDSISYHLSFFCKRKKNNWWDMKCSLPCISDSLQCSFFVSQVNTVKYIQWMIFNSYPLLVVQCNTLEPMQ